MSKNGGGLPRKLLLIVLITALGLGVFFLSSRSRRDASPQTVSLQLIVVRSEAEARSILQQVRSGADFGVIAREKSIDATSIDGGMLGRVDPANLRPELRSALNGMKAGGISNVFKLPGGMAILKVLRPDEVSESEGLERARLAVLQSEKSVRLPFDISGLPEADAALAKMPKADDWYLDLRGVCQARLKSLADVQERSAKFLANHDPATPPYDVMSMLIAQRQVYAFRGLMGEAIKTWQAAYRLALDKVTPAVPHMEELLAIGYLHQSEMDNGVYRNPGDRCLFPMRPGDGYAKKGASEKAIQHFLKCLEQKPDDLELKWLLNIAYMTLGTYPASVPKEYLLPPSAFASSEDIGRFTDVAVEAGLDLFSEAGGIVVDDFDNDGLPDIITSNWDFCGPMHCFRNQGDGTFADRTAKAGLAGQLGGLNMIHGDYNNDGCPDILILRGGWQLSQRLTLLRSNCDLTFTDVTVESGLAKSALSSQTAAWADIDNDGWLDLFVGNENGRSQLFHNNGHGSFENIARRAGTDLIEYTKGVVSADYDNDGYADFYVTNFRGDNSLYHNNRNGTFTEIAKQAGVRGPGHSFAAWFFDYDNDGWIDLFVTNYYMSVAETARTYLGMSHNTGTQKIYRNMGNGAFRDVTAEVGLDKVFMPMGANFGDVDNDGYPDIYLGTGNPAYSSLVPNVLLHNKEGKAFVDITASSGTGDLHKGHGVAFADIDNDGDEDLLTVIGGATPGDSHAFRLFENPGHGNDWLNVRLIGVTANRSAIGARIKATVKNEGGAVRSIYRTVGSGGSFGASPLEQHMGLGKSAQIMSLEIRWPGKPDMAQTFLNVGKNQVVTIREGAPDYQTQVRRPYRLGGPRRGTVAHVR